jgi:hypothetical protein
MARLDLAKGWAAVKRKQPVPPQIRVPGSPFWFASIWVLVLFVTTVSAAHSKSASSTETSSSTLQRAGNSDRASSQESSQSFVQTLIIAELSMSTEDFSGAEKLYISSMAEAFSLSSSAVSVVEVIEILWAGTIEVETALMLVSSTTPKGAKNLLDAALQRNGLPKSNSLRRKVGEW